MTERNMTLNMGFLSNITYEETQKYVQSSLASHGFQVSVYIRLRLVMPTLA
jgi:uncharacterized protein (DUF302 family)